MRPARLVVGLVVAMGVGIVFVSSLDGAQTPRSPSETPAPDASGRGDVKPRRRATAVVGVEAQQDVDESADEDVADEAAACPAAPAAEPSPAPQRVLRIVDEAGAPVVGAWVAGPGDSGARTNLDGEAALDAVGLATATTVRFFDGSKTRALELSDALTECVVSTVPKLDLSFVDGTTGVPLDPVRYELEFETRRKIEAWTCGLRPSLWVDGAGELAFAVSPSPPTGYGCRRTTRWRGLVASRARVLRLTMPLFEATERTFLVQFADGRPASGATVSWVVLAPSDRSDDSDLAVTRTAAPSSSDGILRVGGVPRMPYVRLHYEIDWKGELDGNEQCLHAFERDVDPCAPPPAKPVVLTLSTGGWYRGPCGEVPGCLSFPQHDGPTARLALRVVYRDGTPARNVYLRGSSPVSAWEDHGWTDDDGRSSFHAAPVGDVDVVAASHGFAPTAVRIRVEDDGTEAEIIEVDTRPVRVVVLDTAGRPVPSTLVLARVDWVRSVSGALLDAHCGLAQLDGDAEILQPRTDRTGAVVLQVPRYEVAYDASLGDATAWRSTDADEVEMVLREPER